MLISWLFLIKASLLLLLIALNRADKCAWENCPKWSSEPDAINVHIVAHTYGIWPPNFYSAMAFRHDDMGWIKTADDYYTGARRDLVPVGVQFILNTVIDELAKNPARRFSYAEAGFLHRWLVDHGPEERAKLIKLVTEGQLELIGGGWTQPDEATTHYVNLIDEYSLGLRLFNATFGRCGRPKIAWQIDPFGHSREHANLVAQMGHEGLFFARMHHLELDQRAKEKALEMVWQVSDDLKTNILAGGFLRGTYAPPDGFCFDALCGDEPIVDNPQFENYNLDEKLERFANVVRTEAASQRHGHVMMTMGGDFQYSNANMWFTQLDKLISALNARANRTKISAFYSTPGCYLSALSGSKSPPHLPVKEAGDFFPYATSNHSYWTGYFTSKPGLKAQIRQSSALLQLARTFAVASDQANGQLEKLEQAAALNTHHDAVTGTSKENVTRDYSRRLLAGWADAESLLNVSFWHLALAKASNSSPPSPPHPPLQFCPLLANQSICPISQKMANFSVVLFNGQSRLVERLVRIPMDQKVAKVFDDQGQEVPSEVIATFSGGNQQQVKGMEPAPFELRFQAQLPPLGFRTYFVISEGIKRMLGQNAKQAFWQENLPKLLRTLGEPNRARWAQPEEANGTVISNNYFRLTFGTDGLLAAVQDLRLNRTFRLRQQFHFYRGMDKGSNASRPEQASGAYIFRPNGTRPEDFPGPVQLQIVNSSMAQEARQVVSPWLSQVIRLVPGKPYIEFQWLVGPLPKNESSLQSTEVISRYTLEGLNSAGLFWTDANGRQMVQRKRNDPAKFFEPTEPVSANYYPLNSRILVQDGNVRMAVLTDRSQGGTSPADGQIELMLHRRCFWDDGWGVEEALDEPGEDGRGLVVSGRHWLLLTGPNDSAHRQLALEMFHQPPQSIGFFPLDFVQSNVSIYRQQFQTEFSLLSSVSALPPNVQILTLRPLSVESDKKQAILLRLEHFYQENEDFPRPSDAVPVEVDLQKLFRTFSPVTIDELGLAADRPVANAGPRSGLAGSIVQLRPMEIRTFRIEIARNVGI